MDSIDLSYTSMNNFEQFTQSMDDEKIFEFFENINEISIIISQDHTIEETFSTILEKVLDITGMENGGIYQKSKAGGDYDLTVYNIINEKILQKNSIFQNWKTLISNMNKGVIAISDIAAFSDADRNNMIYNGCHSFIGIPLIKDNVDHGILVASSSDLHEFSEFQKRLFSIIGTHIAGYINQADLVNKLKKSKEMYYDLFHNAGDMIYTHDLDGNFLTMNHAGSDILGYSIQEILQMNVRYFLTEESLETASEFKKQILDDEIISVQPVLEVINKNGEKQFLEFNLRPITEDGELIAVHGIARDVNKRLEAEKNLLIISKAINLTTDGLNISDANHKITFINDAGARLFGYSRRELYGQPANIFYAEEDLPNLEENVIPAMEKHGYWNGLILGRKKDGSVISIEVTLSSAKDENGRPLVNIGVFHERKSNISNT